jgi:hypothetical protein
MKKAFLSFLLVGALAIVSSAQSTRKTPKTTTLKTTNIDPGFQSKTVTKTSSSSSEARANETSKGSTAPAARMIKRKYKHSAVHKMNEKTTK